MKLARGLVLGTLAWLLVVTIGSTLVWAVISRAGQEVVVSAEPVIAPSSAADPRHGSTLTRSASPKPSQDPGSSAAATPSSTAPDTDGATTPTTPAPPATPAAPTAQRRTWQGPGGTVVAQCRGATISLVSYLPDDGYAFEVGERGPEALEVEFEGREDDEGQHAHVVARCGSGIPQFEAEIEGSEGDD